jgi:hypothetical protein
VHGISNHRRAVTNHPCYQLEDEQCQISHTAHQRHLIYLLFPFHYLDNGDKDRTNIRLSEQNKDLFLFSNVTSPLGIHYAINKRPNKIATNDRTKSSQTTEQNRHKRPNKIVTNDRTKSSQTTERNRHK